MTLSNRTETQVQLKGVHLCCGGCVDAVVTAVKSVPGADAQCDMESRTVTLTATDDTTAQKALDAIADAGLHGETGNEHLKMKDEHNIPSGKVRRLRVPAAARPGGAGPGSLTRVGIQPSEGTRHDRISRCHHGGPTGSGSTGQQARCGCPCSITPVAWCRSLDGRVCTA